MSVEQAYQSIKLLSNSNHQVLSKWHLLCYITQYWLPIYMLDQNAQTLLHYSARNQDYEMCQFFLHHPINPMQMDKQSRTPLYWAIEHQDYNLTKLLLQKHIDLQTCYGPSDALSCAIEKDSYQIVELLLQHDIHYDLAILRNRTSPLMVAVNHANTEIVKLLLEHNVPIDSQNNTGETALSFAVALKHFRICQLLMEYGASIWVPGRKSSLFSYVAKEGTLELCKLFLDNYEIQQIELVSAINIAISENNYDLCKMILDHNPNLINISMISSAPLHVALEKDSTLAKLLLEYKPNPNLRTNTGHTALHYAVQHDNVEMVQLLTRTNINYNIPDNHGQIPLHYCKHPEIAQLLLVHSNVHFRDYTANTPLHTVPSEVTKLLIEHSDINAQNLGGYTALAKAVRNSELEKVKILLSHPKVNLRIPISSDLPTILTLNIGMIVCPREFGLNSIDTQLDICDLLLSKDPSLVDMPITNGQYAINLAVQIQNYRLCQILLDHGAQLDKPTHNGQSVFHMVALKNNYDLAKLLTMYSKPCSNLDYKGRTPLHIAAQKSSSRMCQLLLENGANPWTKDNNGKTPHQYVGLFPRGLKSMFREYIKQSKAIDPSSYQQHPPQPEQ